MESDQCLEQAVGKAVRERGSSERPAGPSRSEGERDHRDLRGRYAVR